MRACAYCRTPLRPDDRSCSSCGAPRTEAVAETPPPPPGFERWIDPWAGFALHVPREWAVRSTSPGIVRLEGPEAQVVFGRLPPRVGASPRDVAQSLLGTFPEERHVAVLRDEPQAVTLRIDADPWAGQIQVRLSEQGGLFVHGRARDGSDIHALCNAVLASLHPVQPVPRAPFRDPGEGSFAVACPQGWDVRHTFVSRPSGRLPWCRVFAGPPGHTFVACEMAEASHFVDRPLPQSQPEPKGFWANVGRMVQQAGEAFSGASSMPLGDMRVVLEHHFVPAWLEAIPGSTVVSLEADGPVGFARVRLPDGCLRVVRVESARMPMFGPDNWCAGMVGFYQCPEDEMPRLEPVLQGVLASFQIDPRWRQAEQARIQRQMQQQHQMHMQHMRQSQALHQQRMADIQSAGNAANASWQASQDVLDMQMAGWQSRQGMNDAGHAASVHAVHGTADYVSSAGQVYTGQDVDRMWMHQGGDTFVGGGPALEMGFDWTELKKL